jgi:uncharacterized protein YbjT (DUF2867 family)
MRFELGRTAKVTDEMTTFLIMGGTGTLGSEVVSRLRERGADVVIGSRRPRPAEVAPDSWVTIDYRDARALDGAVARADTLIHCSQSQGGGVDRAVLAAAERVRVPHVVYPSIVGTDRIPFGYYRTKLEAERQLERSGLGFTVLRATQFHDLVFRVASALALSPVMPVPADTSFQPIDAGRVADRLVELAHAGPVGRAPDIGGPEVRPAEALARAYLGWSGKRRRLWVARFPGAAAAALRTGANLVPENAVDGITFEEYLGRRGPLTTVREMAR